MNFKKYVMLSMLVTMLLGLIAFTLPKTVFAEPANSIYVIPSMVNATLMGLGIGDTFDVYIQVNFTTPALFGFEYKFFWNNTLINLVDLEIQLPWSPNFIAKNDTSVAGRYWLGASALSGATPFSGETWVTCLTFQIVYKPLYPEPDMSCVLDLADTKMSDESATPIPHTAYDGEYYICTDYPASGEGDVNGDGIVDISDVVVWAGAFGSQPGDPNWDVDADLNEDDLIDIFDAIMISINYGNTYP